METTTRLVNAMLAYRLADIVGKPYLRTGMGAWGRPEDALEVAAKVPDACGIVIHDVETGERWFVALPGRETRITVGTKLVG